MEVTLIVRPSYGSLVTELDCYYALMMMHDPHKVFPSKRAGWLQKHPCLSAIRDLSEDCLLKCKSAEPVQMPGSLDSNETESSGQGIFLRLENTSSGCTCLQCLCSTDLKLRAPLYSGTADSYFQSSDSSRYSTSQRFCFAFCC